MSSSGQLSSHPFQGREGTKLRWMGTTTQGTLPRAEWTTTNPETETSAAQELVLQALQRNPGLCEELGFKVAELDTRLPSSSSSSSALTPPAPPSPRLHVQVDYLAQGSWNRVFVVQVTQKTDDDERHRKHCCSLILRISLPVCPSLKIESEVATMVLVRGRTDIPVPKVYDYSTSADNVLGYEWILMERSPGITYDEARPLLSLQQKIFVARQLARYLDQLCRIRFDAIGSLRLHDRQHYSSGDAKPATKETEATADSRVSPPPWTTQTSVRPRLGRPVQQYCFADWRHLYRGNDDTPFASVHAYLEYALSFVAHELADQRQWWRALIWDLDDQESESLPDSSDTMTLLAAMANLFRAVAADADGAATAPIASIDASSTQHQTRSRLGYDRLTPPASPSELGSRLQAWRDALDRQDCHVKLLSP